MERLSDNFRPLRGHVLIRRDDIESEKNGIFLPEQWTCSQKDKNTSEIHKWTEQRIRGCRATVVKIGKDVEAVKSGDNILFQKEYTILPFKEREMAITEADYILAKIELDGNVERIMPFGSWVMVLMDRCSDNKNGIYLSDKTINENLWARVIRIGDKCRDVKPGNKVYCNINNSVVCVENDTLCRLIQESEIMAVKIIENNS